MRFSLPSSLPTSRKEELSQLVRSFPGRIGFQDILHRTNARFPQPPIGWGDIYCALRSEGFKPNSGNDCIYSRS